MVALGVRQLRDIFCDTLRNLHRKTFSEGARELPGSNALLNAQIHLELAKIWAPEGPVLYCSGTGVCTLGTGGRLGRFG